MLFKTCRYSDITWGVSSGDRIITGNRIIIGNRFIVLLVIGTLLMWDSIFRFN